MDIPGSAGILRQASKKLLRKLIRNDRYLLDRIQSELYALHLECSILLSEEDFKHCDRITYLQAERSGEFSAQKLNRKYEILLSKNISKVTHLDNSIQNDTVINMSDKDLSEPALRALEKGLNFAPSPKHIPYETIIGNIEETIHHNRITGYDADSLRQDIAVVLRQARSPKSNLTSQEFAALKDLRKDDQVLVLKADKGNTTVVMNVSTYDSKMTDLLSDKGTYKKVKYNPTARVARKTCELIRRYQQCLPDHVVKYLLRPPKTT
ncbi:uncharacterized protein LOC131844914 [Achroia grisella]|uniref:uncharacterized protein LOC131844914 n=1 Tax=Achroia grisella TaxID=688607 RepID=UPI0027D27A9B|nr:uncharacterized protein LOC131844914 [Achroia grisella]